jgi:hypothetical protein
LERRSPSASGAVVITTLLYRAVEEPVVLATQQVATLAGVVALLVVAVTVSSVPGFASHAGRSCCARHEGSARE